MFNTLKGWLLGAGANYDQKMRLLGAIEFQEAFLADTEIPDIRTPAMFENHWPDACQGSIAPFKNTAQHAAWRHICLRGLEAYTGQPILPRRARDGKRDEWGKLCDQCLAHGLGAVQQNNILALRRFANARSVSPREVGRAWAEVVQRGLTQSERLIFRAGIAALDKARAVPEIKNAFRLQGDPIGPLEQKVSRNQEFAMPPDLSARFDAWLDELCTGESVGFRGRKCPPLSAITRQHYSNAMGWFWRCAVAAGSEVAVSKPEELADQVVFDKVMAAADVVTKLRLRPSMKKAYLGKVLPFLHMWNPKLGWLNNGTQAAGYRSTGQPIQSGGAVEKLAGLGAPQQFEAQARCIEQGNTSIKRYLRKPALIGMVRLFELANERQLPLTFKQETIVAYLDDLEGRATGTEYWRRYTNAMEHVAREMGFPFCIVDGFEARLESPV